MKDTAQLTIFIHGVTAALKVYEEFHQLVPLHGTTIKQHSLNLSHIVCVTTNSVPAMTGRLQGKNILVTDMYSHITAFEVKLYLWEIQLAGGQFMHFSCIATCAPDDVDLNTCVGVVTTSWEEFTSRFTVRPLAPGFSTKFLYIVTNCFLQSLICIYFNKFLVI